MITEGIIIIHNFVCVSYAGVNETTNSGFMAIVNRCSLPFVWIKPPIHYCKHLHNSIGCLRIGGYLRRFSSRRRACSHRGRCRMPCPECWGTCESSRNYHRHIRPDPRKNDRRWPVGFQVSRCSCTRSHHGCCGTSPDTARDRYAGGIRCDRCTSYRWMLTGSRKSRNTGMILACLCTGPHSRRYRPSIRLCLSIQFDSSNDRIESSTAKWIRGDKISIEAAQSWYWLKLMP